MSINAISDVEEGIKEGDVIDLMNDYDREGTRYIDLQFIKDQIDPHINNPGLKIKLVSRVKEICEEVIVEVDSDDNEQR